MIVACGGIASLLILPWLLTAMGGSVLAGADPLPHINWLRPPSLRRLARFYVSIFGAGPRLLAGLVLLTLAFLGAAYMRRAVTSRSLPTIHVLLILVGIGVPMMTYGVSIVGPRPVFAERQLLGAAVAFVATV
jgi:hypothetical protein